MTGAELVKINTPPTSKQCAFNEEFSVNGIIKDSLVPKPNGKITYVVQVDRQDGCELTLLIDPDTGYMAGKYSAATMVREQSTTCTATMSAVETIGHLPPQAVVLETFAVTFRHKDTLFPLYGPNNKGRDHQGQPQDLDGNSFNQAFIPTDAQKDTRGTTAKHRNQPQAWQFLGVSLAWQHCQPSRTCTDHGSLGSRCKSSFESQLDEISMRANGELPETIESNYVNPTYEVAPAVMINTLLTESNLDGGAGRAYVAGYKHQQPHDFHSTLAQATASGEAPSMHGGSTYANGEETPVRRRESAAPTARN